MNELLERARKFLEDNPFLNEVELEDENFRVRVVRNGPQCIAYPPAGFTPGYWQYVWHLASTAQS